MFSICSDVTKQVFFFLWLGCQSAQMEVHMVQNYGNLGNHCQFRPLKTSVGSLIGSLIGSQGVNKEAMLKGQNFVYIIYVAKNVHGWVESIEHVIYPVRG